MIPPILFRDAGLNYYLTTWEAMKQFTANRSEETRDEIWLLEHYPVFTQGTSCKALPLENNYHIPVIHSDRGGQITYHGPGQLVVYFLLDLKRRSMGPKKLVKIVEESIIDLLIFYGIPAHREIGAPGVYVYREKIAALGFRIKNGYCYHGFSLNVDMDLGPFLQIHPCGFEKLSITQMRRFLNIKLSDVNQEIQMILQHRFE